MTDFVFRVSDASNFRGLIDRIQSCSTVYKVGSYGHGGKTQEYLDSKRAYSGSMMVSAHVDDRKEAIQELLKRCGATHQRNVESGSAPSTPGTVYVVGKKV